MADFVLGLEGVVYRNIGTYDTPVWEVLPNVRKVSNKWTSGSWDAGRRGIGGWGQDARTLKRASIEIEIVYLPGDAGYKALRSEYLFGGGIDLAILSNPIATVGSEGMRAQMDVHDIDRDEPLEEGMIIKVTVKPRPSTNAPQWVESDGVDLVEVTS